MKDAAKKKDSDSRVISLHFHILYCHGCVEISQVLIQKCLRMTGRRG